MPKAPRVAVSVVILALLLLIGCGGGSGGDGGTIETSGTGLNSGWNAFTNTGGTTATTNASTNGSTTGSTSTTGTTSTSTSSTNGGLVPGEGEILDWPQDESTLIYLDGRPSPGQTIIYSLGWIDADSEIKNAILTSQVSNSETAVFRSATFSDDRTRIAYQTGSPFQKLILAESGKPARAIFSAAGAPWHTYLSFSKDGKRLAITGKLGSASGLWIYHVDSNQLEKLGSVRYGRISFSLDGTKLLGSNPRSESGLDSPDLYLIDSQTGESNLIGQGSSAIFARDGQHIVYSEWDAHAEPKTIIIQNYATGAKRSLPVPNSDSVAALYCVDKTGIFLYIATGLNGTKKVDLVSGTFTSSEIANVTVLGSAGSP
ncbi:MAG: hypothetical protein ACAH95_02215 [Fimbriimonas sp.]